MTLLTPPSSSHRGEKDKENKYPAPGPSTRSVVWATENSIHSLSTPPKPNTIPSRQRPQASRSILKKSDRNISLSILAVNKQREVTPEPNDPLVDLHYLDYPVSRIISIEDPDSLESLAQLIEGYNVLAARLRACVSDSTDADASWPLFQPLRKNKDALVDAIVRDLGRALVDPLSLCITPEAEEEIVTKCPLPSPKSSPSKKKDGMTAEQVKFARDLCTTCHSVIKALSAVLSSPAICNVFEEKHLRRILTAILAIPLAEELPTPNTRKTCALAICLIQVQRLPAAVLQPAADRIAYALRRGIDGELGKEGKKGSANDGLKAIHDLSVYLPGVFIPAFVHTLPSILSNLLANTLALRTQACHALGGFVVGLVSLPQSTIHTNVAAKVSTFLTTQSTPTKKSPNKSTDPAIVRTLNTTLRAEEPEHVAQGPIWSLIVISSFIVMLGSRLSTDRQVIRILTTLLSFTLRHRKSSIRGLTCLAWRCITWAYFQPPHPIESDEESEVDDDTRKESSLAKDTHRKIMMSVVDLQAGVNIIGAFLGDSSTAKDEALKLSLEVLGTMAGKSGQTTSVAAVMMEHLVSESSGPDEQDTWNHSALIPKPLFSSNPSLLAADYKFLHLAVRPLYDGLPSIEQVRHLTREEISKEFVFSGMMAAWKAALGCVELGDEADIPSEMTNTWGCLLKANLGYLQDNGDDASIPKFAVSATKYLIDILEDLKLDLTPNKKLKGVAPTRAKTLIPDSDEIIPDYDLGPSHCTNGQLCVRVVARMWATMKTVFPHASLNEAGETLLACLMRNERTLLPENGRLGSNQDEDEGEGVRTAWVSMCINALSVCGDDAMKVFWGCEEGTLSCGKKEKGTWGWDWTKDFTNAVWKTSVEKWNNQELHWEGGIVLLGVPFTDRHTWNLSGEDFALWEDFLATTTTKALDHGVDSYTVLDNIASFVSSFQSPDSSPFSSARIADLLLTHLDTPEIRELPTNLVDLVAETMRMTYPPEPRNKQVMMWMTRSLSSVIENCPPEFCMSLFETLQEGLCIWLNDNCDSWTKDELSYDIINLYQQILVRIQVLPEDVSTLNILGPILDAAFHHKDHSLPGVELFTKQASEAFIEYWNIAYARVAIPAKGWPESITHALQTVGLLAKEEAPVVEATTPLKPAFVVNSSPRTPIASSFSTPPTAVLKREGLSQIPSPQRPQKVFGTFPIVPTSPVSPLRRRTKSSSSSASVRRTPLSAIQPFETPSKRRRLNSDNTGSAKGQGNKENLTRTPLVSVAERIAEMMKSGGNSSSKKRRLEEDDDESKAKTTPTKKLKGRMKPRFVKPTFRPKAPSPAPSAASSNESEDERWVEGALKIGVPFPSMDISESIGAQAKDATGESPVEMPRRKRELGMLRSLDEKAAPSIAQSQSFQQKREYTTSLDGQAYDAPTRKINLAKVRTVKRSVSIPEAMLAAKSQKRKRCDSDLDSDADLYDLTKAHPLPSLQLKLLPPPSAPRQPVTRRAFSLPDPHQWSDSDMTAVVSSSDDDPHLGQVTPHHLVSPAMYRKGPILRDYGELFGSDDSLPGSDDSTGSGSDDSEESPTKEFVSRQLQRRASESMLLKSVMA